LLAILTMYFGGLSFINASVYISSASLKLHTLASFPCEEKSMGF
jgi:hypothetical protein